MSSADAVAVVLWIGVTMYAVFGGADFGAGFWSLLAGGGERGRRPRELIDWAIGPVWEANHVWLIFVLVVLWTGFSSAFEAIFSTLFIPLSLAALGIVLRGAGLRVPQDRAARTGAGRWPSALRARVAAHAVLHGHGRRRDRGRPRAGRQRRGRRRDELAQPALARDRGALRRHRRLPRRRCSSSATPAAPAPPDLERYFATRALVAAVVAGALAAAGLVALHGDARYVYDGLTERRAAARDPLAALRRRRARAAPPRRPARRPRRSRSAPSPP